MSEIFDEKLNVKIGKVAYTIAEREIMKAVIGVVEKTADRELFEDFDLKQLLENSFEEALGAVYGNEP